jgi:predicted nucleotidyltransferase
MGLVEAVQTLAREGVRFVVVGGVAATIHGARRVTEDLDVCYDDAPANVRLLARILADWRAYPRHWPDGLPFFMDERTFRTTPTMTFRTVHGDVDVLHRVEPIGGYAEVAQSARVLDVFGAAVPTLDLAPLVRVKQYVNRPKDRDALPELEALLAERV